MREIKFRAKLAGDWVYGGGVQMVGGHCAMISIENNEMIIHSVDRKTVGQWTGLFDCDGNEIYEGDVIRVKHHMEEMNRKRDFFNGVVEYIGCQFNCRKFNFLQLDNPTQVFSEGTEHIKVIGNIHDNPEMI